MHMFNVICLKSDLELAKFQKNQKSIYRFKNCVVMAYYYYLHIPLDDGDSWP